MNAKSSIICVAEHIIIVLFAISYNLLEDKNLNLQLWTNDYYIDFYIFISKTVSGLKEMGKS